MGGRSLAIAVVALAINLDCRRPAAPQRPNPIRTQNIARDNPRTHLVIARIDLSDPRVHLAVCAGGPDPDGTGPWATVLRTPTDIARENKLDLAINGGFFTHQAAAGDPTKYSAGDTASATAMVIIDGQFSGASHVGDAFAVDANGSASIAHAADVLAMQPRYAVGGPAMIVDRGEVVAPFDEPPAPRTAVGLTQDRKTMICIVVDGRRAEWGLGMTPKQLASELIDAGAYTGLLLDGGGSSAMAVKGADARYRLLSRPSDGSTLPMPLSVERPVAYVIGVRVEN